MVKYALESTAETGTYKMHQGRGRKRKLTEADVRHLKILSTRDRRKTTADLQAEINASRSESENISRMTISRQLMEQGLKGGVAAKKPLLRPVNIQKHLRFAREHKHWTVDDSKKVLWTDESKFELFGHRCVYVRRKDGGRFDARCTFSETRWRFHHGMGLHLWKRRRRMSENQRYHERERLPQHLSASWNPFWTESDWSRVHTPTRQ